MLVYSEFLYDELTIYRVGTYTITDIVIGLLMLGLLFELSRKAYFTLFLINVCLICLVFIFPYLPPPLWHPGIHPLRIITDNTFGFQIGLYGDYTQTSFTLIAPFLFFLAIITSFGAQKSMVTFFGRLVGKRRYAIPQVAVLSSMMIGTSSGAASANVAATGSFTIPLMKSYKLSPEEAGAIEVASSLGGQIMPPIMGIAAFLMAEFMGVRYLEVIIRGFAVALVYYITVAFSVHLISSRRIPRSTTGGISESTIIEIPILTRYHLLNIACFFTCIALLIYLLCIVKLSEMLSAIYSVVTLLTLMTLIHVLHTRAKSVKELLGCYRHFLREFGKSVSDLTILLATLSVMVGVLTITGVILEVGGLMVRAAGWNIYAMIGLAFIFGWLVGLGIPPAATYIVVLVVILSPFIRCGVNPWIIHFFAFFLGIWSELSPPTSLSSAVASNISGGSFNKTMIKALVLTSPLILMTFSIFVRSNIILIPGIPQFHDALLIIIGCLCTAYMLLGYFSKRLIINLSFKILVGILGLIFLFYPNAIIPTYIAPIAIGLLVLGVTKHMKLTAAS